MPSLSEVLSKGFVTESQLAYFCHSLFPHSARTQKISRPTLVQSVSPGWFEALNLVQLSKLTNRKCGGHSTTPANEEHAVLHILNNGRFPYHRQGLMLCLFLLKTWRDLHTAQMEQFPTELSFDAANHVAIHFSNCKTHVTGYAAWEESLQLYLHMIRNASSSSRSGIQNLRHTILITLLDHNQWSRALHFFNHSLSQNDMPNHKSVGYLSQHLSEQGQWRAVLLLFEMCVKLLRLRSKVNCSTSPLKEDRIARDWGTTISMIMRAVAKRNPSQINEHGR